MEESVGEKDIWLSVRIVGGWAKYMFILRQGLGPRDRVAHYWGHDIHRIKFLLYYTKSMRNKMIKKNVWDTVGVIATVLFVVLVAAFLVFLIMAAIDLSTMRPVDDTPFARCTVTENITTRDLFSDSTVLVFDCDGNILYDNEYHFTLMFPSGTSVDLYYTRGVFHIMDAGIYPVRVEEDDQ